MQGEKQGLLETKCMSSSGELSGVYQITTRGPGSGSSGRSKGSSSSSKSSATQYTSRSASKRSSVASFKDTAKEGGYELWTSHIRSHSLSSGDSGSSDELFSRTSNSSTSTHCHDITTDTPEDRLALCKLTLATVLSLVFMLLDYVGGYYSSSLAVLSDAGYLLSNFCGFLVSLVALCLARRPPSATMSFGYYRAEVLGSVASVLIVWVVTGLLVAVAVQRILYTPYTLDPDIMLITASVGIIVKILLAVILQGCGCYGYFHTSHKSTRKPITLRAAIVYVVTDTLQTLAVMVAALVVYVRPEYKIADPILTFVFGFIVVLSTLPILRELAHILMEGFPRNVDYLCLLTDLEGLPGVRTVHNLHMWSLTLDKNALSVHLVIDQSFDPETVLEEAHKLIRRNYSVSTSTIQIEKYAKEMETCKKCQTPSL